ncbi:MAG: hypothetical protein KDI04_12195, partial [Halieaceae bacterium]|nr:hypothetical protein [Halieaceae bacterium]
MTKPYYRLLVPAALALALWGCQDKPDTVAAEQQDAAPPTAERVFINGAIYTADGEQRSVNAMAISGDKILFVG